MTKADKVVMTSAIVTMGSTMGASFLPPSMGGQGELPSPKLLFGSALTFAGLSMLGDFAPGLAIPMAATIGFTAVLYYGVPLMDCYVSDGTSETCQAFKRQAEVRKAAKDAATNPNVQPLSPTPTTPTTVR